MKTLRSLVGPTRSRRLNEIAGLALLFAALLLLVALATYAPADPSLNTVGATAGGRVAHNWIGVTGALVADALLQSFGVAVFFLPFVAARIGVRWVQSLAAGSPAAKTGGVLLWLLFAPAALSLLPGHLQWRGVLPIGGVSGLLLSDFLVQYLNVPGASAVLVLLVAVALYLTTTFTFGSARPWLSRRLGFLRPVADRWAQWRLDRRNAAAERALQRMNARRADETGSRLPAERAGQAPQSVPVSGKAPLAEAVPAKPRTLLGGLFGWMGKRPSHEPEPDEHEQHAPAAVTESGSVWQAMPRTVVDEAPLPVAGATEMPTEFPAGAGDTSPAPGNGFGTSAAGVRGPLQEQIFEEPSAAGASSRGSAAAFPGMRTAATEETVQTTGTPQAISFGRRADSDVKPVAIVPKSVRGYKLPPSSLLYHSEEHAQVREDALRDEARVLVEKCAEFDVDGQVTQINPGPVVTTFEFKPDAGVKYSRVTGLADDLCLAMAAESILIERMAGKSTVGIQVPNAERETIWLRDVVECESFAQSKSRLAIALGKDINGRIVTGDLASMPHVLIAGSTGSGKSVAINAMIMSVLFKSTPEQVRMILVDPKRVELGMYEGIPHLFTPIITEAKLAANALRNAVREMERRLKLLASHHVRNIDQYNKMVESATPDMFEDSSEQEPLPYIMIIIDELADLMMLDRANVEEAITRLAQMARAVGIHLVLATQRPSVDVITGLIKANVPTRMSFRLATKVDSRTIIDSNGAESLLGRGDMLYLPPGTSRVQRVHAPFVTEKEIGAVVAFWKEQGEAEYVQGFLEGPKDEKVADGEMGSEEDANDELYNDAVRLVFEFGKASTSLLQRRLRIGYGRAAHLIDLMHRDGLVGPADGSKPRELLKPANWIHEVDAAMR